MTEKELFEKVSKALAKGYDVEIKMTNDGVWRIYTYKKNRVL